MRLMIKRYGAPICFRNLKIFIWDIMTKNIIAQFQMFRQTGGLTGKRVTDNMRNIKLKARTRAERGMELCVKCGEKTVR